MLTKNILFGGPPCRHNTVQTIPWNHGGIRIVQSFTLTRKSTSHIREWEGLSQWARADNASSDKKKQAHLGVSHSFLLKFPQRPCCSGLWKGTNDFFEKQNIFYKSFPANGWLLYKQFSRMWNLSHWNSFSSEFFLMYRNSLNVTFVTYRWIINLNVLDKQRQF